MLARLKLLGAMPAPKRHGRDSKGKNKGKGKGAGRQNASSLRSLGRGGRLGVNDEVVV